MVRASDVTAGCGRHMNIRKIAAYRRSAGVLQFSGCRQIGAVLGGALAVSLFVLLAAHLQGMPPAFLPHLPFCSEATVSHSARVRA